MRRRKRTGRYCPSRGSRYGDSFSPRASVLRHGMPYLWLKDCHVAALLAMTRNWDGFVWETDVFALCGRFFAVLLRIVFRTFRHHFPNVSFRKLLRFPAKPIRFVIARRARAPDAAIFDGTKRHLGTMHGKVRAMIYSWRLYNG